MDSLPPTAHIIGGDHPPSGDFAQMMYSGGRHSQQYVPQTSYAQPIQ